MASRDRSRSPRSAALRGSGGQASDVLVLCGPIVGKVTASEGQVLLEVDEDAEVSCVARPTTDGAAVKATVQMRASTPAAFVLKDLKPGTQYDVRFEGLAEAQLEELAERGCRFRTMPVKPESLRIVALSCDRPDRLLRGQENPWGRLAELSRGGGYDVMLHLGDQVYTKSHDRMEAAMRSMDIIDRPSVGEKLRLKLEHKGLESLQDSYRTNWNHEATATTLAHCSHLMIWSDNDVANDFTILKDKDGNQAYTPAFLRVGMRVYRMYQRQLWDPTCTLEQVHLESMKAVEEWHFTQYGPCGIFMIDMKGNRITPNGVQREGDILSPEQRQAIQDAFATPGLSCMVLGAEIPFVGDTPDRIKKTVSKVPKLVFLKDHWPYQIEELLWLLDLCFQWKAAVPGREVLLLAGDIHVSVDSTIKDAKTGLTIRHITTSPITNHVCKFFPKLKGSLNDRYSYTHKVLDNMRTYATVDLRFQDGKTTASVEMTQIPALKPEDDSD